MNLLFRDCRCTQGLLSEILLFFYRVFHSQFFFSKFLQTAVYIYKVIRFSICIRFKPRYIYIECIYLYLYISGGLKILANSCICIRNVTETISPPFDARTEEMKRNSQNIFGLYKTLRNLSR